MALEPTFTFGEHADHIVQTWQELHDAIEGAFSGRVPTEIMISMKALQARIVLLCDDYKTLVADSVLSEAHRDSLVAMLCTGRLANAN